MKEHILQVMNKHYSADINIIGKNTEQYKTEFHNVVAHVDIWKSVLNYKYI